MRYSYLIGKTGLSNSQITVHTEVIIIHWQLGAHFVLVVYYLLWRQIHDYDSARQDGIVKDFSKVSA